MRCKPIRYLDWARHHLEESPPAYNLGNSAISSPTAAEAGIDLAELRFAGGHAFGHPGLRSRIGAAYDVTPSRVVIATGTSLANFLIISTLVHEGAVVVCEWPAYEPLWRAAEAQGARLKWIKRDAENNYKPDISSISREFARGARLLILSDLHNPSAALLGRDILREVGRLAAKYDAWVLVDEVYLSGVFDEQVESAVGLGDRLIVTASLTKSYGLGGLRAGWAIAPEAIVDQAHVVSALSVGNGSFLAEDAAFMAFGHLDELRQRSARKRAENWPLVRTFARERHMLEQEPAGAFICWLKLPLGIDSDRFVEHLTLRYDTVVVPGSFFGSPDHIRIGFGQSREVLEEGLRRVGRALDDMHA